MLGLPDERVEDRRESEEARSRLRIVFVRLALYLHRDQFSHLSAALREYQNVALGDESHRAVHLLRWGNEPRLAFDTAE